MKRNCRQIGVNFKGLDMRKTLIVLHTHTHTHTHLIADEKKISVSRSPAGRGDRLLAYTNGGRPKGGLPFLSVQD